MASPTGPCEHPRFAHRCDLHCSRGDLNLPQSARLSPSSRVGRRVLGLDTSVSLAAPGTHRSIAGVKTARGLEVTRSLWAGLREGVRPLPGGMRPLSGQRIVASSNKHFGQAGPIRTQNLNRDLGRLNVTTTPSPVASEAIALVQCPDLSAAEEILIFLHCS